MRIKELIFVLTWGRSEFDFLESDLPCSKYLELPGISWLGPVSAWKAVIPKWDVGK